MPRDGGTHTKRQGHFANTIPPKGDLSKQRIHKRASRRMANACRIMGKDYTPGTKVPNEKGQLEFTAGGAFKYY